MERKNQEQSGQEFSPQKPKTWQEYRVEFTKMFAPWLIAEGRWIEENGERWKEEPIIQFLSQIMMK